MSHALAAVRHRARRARVTQNSKLKTQNYPRGERVANPKFEIRNLPIGRPEPTS